MTHQERGWARRFRITSPLFLTVTLLPLSNDVCAWSPERSVSSQGQAAVDGEPPHTKAYSFSKDWVTSRIPLWNKTLAHVKGRPGLQYLEIGVFEGRSAIWMLENVLTDPTASMTCIDIFPGRLQETFLANLALSGFSEKVTVIKGRSQVKLRKLPLKTFDIIYIDGSHITKDVLVDAVLSWQLLKTGGIMMFDDYKWKKGLPAQLQPQIAIDSFLTVFQDQIKIIHHDDR